MEQARTRKVEQAARGRPLRPWGLEPGGGLAALTAAWTSCGSLVSDGGLDELRGLASEDGHASVVGRGSRPARARGGREALSGHVGVIRS